MNTKRNEESMRVLFQRIGTETPSEDFTEMVMNKIKARSLYNLSHDLPKSNYWFLMPYLIAMLIIIPFIVPTINWIINIDWNFILNDIAVIREWFGSFLDKFSGISISNYTMILSLAFSVLLILLSIELFAHHRRILN